MTKEKDTHGITKDMCRMVTPKFRVSYPHLFKPQAMKGAEPKYSITMLFPKDEAIEGQTLQGKTTSLKQIMTNAKLMKYGPKENWPKSLRSPVTDGDDPEFKDREGYAGHWVVKAVSMADAKPGVVNKDMSPITEQSEIYPGCYARALIFARVWEHPTGGKGLHFIVDHVQKLGEGKSFGGKVAVEQVFQAVEDEDSETGFADDNGDEAEMTF